MKLLIALSGVLGLLPMTSASAAPPVQVMVLGSYHFGNPGLDVNNAKADDVLTPRRQKEIQAVAAALAAWKPTAIMVEREAERSDLVDANFLRSSPADLTTKRDERVQIGYRLAWRLKVPVYAIDEKPRGSEPDYFPYERVQQFADTHGQADRIRRMTEISADTVRLIEQGQKTRSVADILAELNGPAALRRNVRSYYSLLDVGDGDAQPGAELNGLWFMRNAKIFAKVMKVARPGDRVLVIFGAGHSYWLRQLASETPGFTFVDPVPFLRRAVRK
jgi:hypothetical protein